MGEVIRTTKATPSETAQGELGTVAVEGSRSQAIPEALVTVTKDTRIVDKHDNKSPATFDTIRERQTVEVWFDVSSENPWKAKASKISISP